MQFLVNAFAWYETHQAQISAAIEAAKALKPAVAGAVRIVKDAVGKPAA